MRDFVTLHIRGNMKIKFIIAWALVLAVPGVIQSAAASGRSYADILKTSAAKPTYAAKSAYTQEQQKAREADALATRKSDPWGQARKNAEWLGLKNDDLAPMHWSLADKVDWALCRNDERTARFLVQHKADMSSKHFCALPACSLPMAKLLLDAGARCESDSLMYTYRMNIYHLERVPQLVMLLTHYGASPRAVNHEGHNVLQLFVARHRLDAVMRKQVIQNIERLVRYMVGVGVPTANPFAAYPNRPAYVMKRFEKMIDAALIEKRNAAPALKAKLKEVFGELPQSRLLPPLCDIVVSYTDPCPDSCNRELQAALEGVPAGASAKEGGAKEGGAAAGAGAGGA